MKRFDLVDVRWPNAKEFRLPPRFHAIVVGKNGDNLIVMNAAGETFQPFEWSCHRVHMTEALRELRLQMIEVARSDAGKASIRGSRAPVTARYERKTIGGRLVRVDVDLPLAPAPGHGFPDVRVEPLVLTEGMTSNPTETLLRHIEFWGTRFASARDELSPALQEVVSLVVDRGLSSKEAAAELGISLTALDVRLHRARCALRRSVGTSAELLSGYSARRDEDVTRNGR